jgi:hypothetical protein
MRSVADLDAYTVEITPARLFDLLGITVSCTNEDPEEALEKRRRKEIAAVALVARKPAPVLSAKMVYIFSLFRPMQRWVPGMCRCD